jgi:GNAT superfamily N-acetyltransferase
MTRARVLPVEEWSRLDGTELEPLLHRWCAMPGGVDVDVVVVERDGRIVGRWLRLTMHHVEGLWIDPEFRGRSGIARRLWAAMKDVCRGRGADTVLTGAQTDDVRRLLEHAGADPLPTQYVLPMGE